MFNSIFNTSFLKKLFFKFFKNKNYYFYFFKKRFLIKKYIKYYFFFENIFFFEFFKHVFNNYNLFIQQKLLELNLVFLYIKNNYKMFRYFFGYPSVSKTRSNAKNAKKKSLVIKNIIIKYIFYKLFRKQKEQDKLLLLFVEFFNKLWFIQWNKDWRLAKEQLENAMQWKYSRWKFGYLLLTYNRPLLFSVKKSKVKSNKKKQVEFKNMYNIGFILGFAIKNKEIIKRFNRLNPYNNQKSKKK